MVPLARSLRTRPDHELERAQAEAARAANRAPAVEATIRAELIALAERHGADRFHKVAAKFVRETRPEIIRLRPNPLDAAEALFAPKQGDAA